MTLREITLGGVLMALGLGLPLLFHALGLGATFLPMLQPVLAAGLLLSWRPAVAVGVATPLFSSLLTGMPPMAPPIAVAMALEGAVLAGLASFLYCDRGWPLHGAAAAAVVAERLVMVAAALVWAPWFGLPARLTATGLFVQGLPGVAMLIIAVPVLVRGAQSLDQSLDRKRHAPSQTAA